MNRNSQKQSLVGRLRNSLAAYIFVAIVAIGVIIVAVSSLAAYMVAGWEQRDAELRARLVFRSIRDQVATDVERPPQTRLIPLLDRITEDERILALGFCLQSGELLFATKEMPPKSALRKSTARKVGHFRDSVRGRATDQRQHLSDERRKCLRSFADPA